MITGGGGGGGKEKNKKYTILKRSRLMLFIRTKHNMRIFRAIPFIAGLLLFADLKQHIRREGGGDGGQEREGEGGRE